MVKVCHVTSVHQNNDGRIFRLECQSLVANGYEVYLVAQGESREENGVHVIGIGKAPENRVARMLVFARRIIEKAIDLDCDIYHLHDPELLQFALLLKKKGKTVIFDSHENTLAQIEEKEWIPTLVRRSLSNIYIKYASYVFKRLDALVSVTPHIVEQLKGINKNTWMITNYPRFVQYEKKDKEGDINRICFTGGIESQWNHDRIIRIINDIDDIEYVLCGSGDDDYLSHLKKIPGWRKVKYLGRVPFSKAIDVQLSSHIGVALLKPSKNTGGKVGSIGNTKLFEYMMAGLPIVCTDFILWKEIIDNYKCGITVSINDNNGISDAIKFIMDNRTIAEEMGRNGMEAVREKYNWSTQEKKLIKMYKELTLRLS